jgi:hypothetical protein
VARLVFAGVSEGAPSLGYPTFKKARKYHSFTFPQSGYTINDNTVTMWLSQLTLQAQEWVCEMCGTYHVRDHRAVRNIKTVGAASRGYPSERMTQSVWTIETALLQGCRFVGARRALPLPKNHDV